MSFFTRFFPQKIDNDPENLQPNMDRKGNTAPPQNIPAGQRQRSMHSRRKKASADDNDIPSNTSLLQIGVVFLAVVSFFTTANGMKEYIFRDNSLIAYAASAAIQSILLALSMNLPGYIKGIWQQKHFWITKLLLSILALALTVVTIFCSSWFSYVYIAAVIHQDSWGTDSELLVQQTYRTELYQARDYAHAYRTHLEEDLGEKILLLERQSRNLSGEMFTEMDWENEKTRYVDENGDTAASYMAPVIEIMSRIFGNNTDPTAEQYDLSTTAISDAKDNVSIRLETIQQSLETINTNISNYNDQIANLTRRIENATEETDTSDLYASLSNYTQLVRQATEEQVRLQAESMDLDRVFLRLSNYESLIGLNNSTSTASIRVSLLQLQSEFFLQDPDAARLSSLATSIFDSLRTAAGSSTEGGNMSSEDSLTYTNLLIQMNQLLRNLTDYSTVKSIEMELEGLITDLHPTDENKENEGSNAHDPASAVDTVLAGNSPTAPDSEAASPEPNDPLAEPGDASPDPDGTTTDPGEESPAPGEQTTEPGDIATPEPENAVQSPSVSSSDLAVSSPEPNSSSLEGSGTEDSMDSWKKDWGERLETLKSLISAMPAYGDSAENEEDTTAILTESQIGILRTYDRNESSKALDDMIRRYIASHNAIYEGIIYLQSPYRSLALFALILAFSFDLSGFIFGVIIQGKGSRIQAVQSSVMSSGGKGKQAQWSILETLHSYIVLTGDFEHRDETYYYKVFRNGLLEEWLVQDETAYHKGIYLQDKEDPKKGKAVSETEQALLFTGQTGKQMALPADRQMALPASVPNEEPVNENTVQSVKEPADPQMDSQDEEPLSGPADGIYVNCHLTYDDGGLILLREDGTLHFVASINEYVPVHSYNPVKGESQTIPARQLAKIDIHAKLVVIALNVRGTMVSAIYIIEE